MPIDAKNMTVPLNFELLSNSTGAYTFSASNIESFVPGSGITLEDLKTNSTQDLVLNPIYHFNYTAGDNASRFLLHFYHPTYGIEESDKQKDFQIYSSGHDVYVKANSGIAKKGEFYLYNLLGQQINHQPLNAIQLNKYSTNVNEGYYLVGIITSEKAYYCRVFLN